MRQRTVLVGLLLVLAGAAVFAQGPVTPSAAVTSTVYSGQTPLIPKFRIIDAASSGDNTIIEAFPGGKIRVLAWGITMTGTAVTIRWEAGASGTALTGQMTPLQGTNIIYPFNPIGWFETSTNQLLNLELGGAQSVDGSIVYVVVPN